MDPASIVASPSSGRDQLQQLSNLLQQAVNDRNIPTLQSYVREVFCNDNLSLSLLRPLIAEYARAITSLPDDLHQQIAQYTLQQLHPRAQSFEAALTAIRIQLATVLETQEQFTAAANVLASIRWDGSLTNPDFKVDTLVKTARFYLLENNAADAEPFINNAMSLITKHGSTQSKLRFHICHATMLEYKLRFLDAAVRYYQLSQREPNWIFEGCNVGEAEVMEWLKQACICIVLASAGPRRSRFLGLLYSDERTRGLEIFALLEAIYMERFVRNEQIVEFDKEYLKNKKFLGRGDREEKGGMGGGSVLEKAMRMHNVLAAAKLYKNIRFEDLGELLGVEKDVAERIAADMVYEKRLDGVIDQVDGVVVFEMGKRRENSLLRWNEQVEGVCHAADDCAAAILKVYPQFAE